MAKTYEFTNLDKKCEKIHKTVMKLIIMTSDHIWHIHRNSLWNTQ